MESRDAVAEVAVCWYSLGMTDIEDYRELQGGKFLATKSLTYWTIDVFWTWGHSPQSIEYDNFNEAKDRFEDFKDDLFVKGVKLDMHQRFDNVVEVWVREDPK